MDTPNEGIARARGRRVIVPTVGAISYAATSKSLARRKRVEKGDGDSAGVGKEKKEKKTLPKPVHKRKPKTSEKGAGSDKEETKKKKKSKTSPKNKPAKETDELESEEEKEREIEEEEDEREFEEEEEEEEDDESKEEKKGRKKKVSKGEGGGGSGGGEGKEAKKLPKKKGKPIPEDVVKPGAETITITFGDQAENHVGMQTIGTKAAAGFTTDELAALGWEMHDLTPMWVHASDNQGLEAPAASIAILRGGVDVLMGAGAIARLTTEIKSKSVDKKALMRKKVVNKHARWNSIFGDKSQVPSYAEGKGTVHPFTELPELSALRHRLPQVLGSKAKGLVGELNQYYDNTKCGIGFHGDTERMIVVGVRLGASMSLVFQWFLHSNAVGEPLTLMLNDGDIYVMSQYATGNNWKRRIVPTLRHAAGAEKYTCRPKRKTAKPKAKAKAKAKAKSTPKTKK